MWQEEKHVEQGGKTQRWKRWRRMRENRAGESQRWSQKSKEQQSRRLHKEAEEIGAFETVPNLENRQ